MDSTAKKYYNCLKDLRTILMSYPDTNVRSFLIQKKVDQNLYNVLIAAKIIKAIDIGSLWIGAKPSERMVKYLRTANKNLKSSNTTIIDIEEWTDRGEVRILESYIKILGFKIKIYHNYG